MDNFINYSNVLTMSFAPAERQHYELHAGDILLNEGQDTDLVGRSAIYDGPRGMFFQNTLIRFRPGPMVCPSYAQAVFSHWRSNRVFARAAKQTTSIAHLGLDRFANMLFPLRDLTEQLRIAEILTAIDSSIDCAELELAKHRTVAEAMMRALLNVIEPSEMASVGDCYSIATGLTLGPHRQALTRTAPYLRVANVQRRRLDLTDIAVTGIQQAERDRYSLQAGDLLVVEGHADPGQIGRCAQVDDIASGFLYQNHLFRLRSPNIAPEFGLAWLNSDTARAYWRVNCATSSGLYTINGSLLAQMPMPLATDEAQNQVVRLARASNESVDAAADTLGKLRMVKKGLMDDLLTGRIRVGELSM